MPTRSLVADPRGHRTSAGRQAPARRRRTLLRRRVAGAIAVVVVGVVGMSVVWPTLHHAVREITLPLHHADIVRQQARAKHLDPALVAAVIDAESKFNDNTSSSSAGAVGLMQLVPDTARFIASRSGATSFSTADLATPQVNISYGSWYLRYLLDRYGGSTVLAVAAYNAGEANVDRWLVADSFAGRHFSVSRIPFPETRAYVAKVLALRDDYRTNYASDLGL